MMVAIMVAASALVGAAASSPALAVAGGTAPAPPLVCTGDGTSGNRVQIVYTYEGTNNKLSLREAAIRQAIWEAQQNINDSARRDGGQRYLNVVHDANCHAVIDLVQVPDGKTDTPYWVHNLDLDASNRIYLVISEESLVCCDTWNDNVANDSTPGIANLHNHRAAWALLNQYGVNGHNVTHELAHALSAEFPDAPNSDGGGHCTDGHETLCQPETGAVCPDPLHVRLLDCNGDDYFSLNPTGSYLPTHWNVALHSLYLTPGPSVTPLINPIPLPPQYLKAVDVEGDSIAFSFRQPGYSDNATASESVTAYEIHRNGVLAATIPTSEWRSTARVDGMPTNFTAHYTVRSRVTVGGVSRYSNLSQALSVTTSTSSARAGDVESGAVMLLSNENVQPDGDRAGAYQTLDSINAGPTEEHAWTKQYPRTEGTNQQWELTSATGGTYTLRSKHGGKCLSVLGSSTSAGADIVQSTCTAAANQRWTFVPLIGLTYQLRNANSNLCIQTENLSANIDAYLVQGTCTSSEPSQRWTVHQMG